MNKMFLLLALLSQLIFADVGFKYDRLQESMTTITTSGGTTTLVAISDPHQRLTGTSAHTYVLPDATTLPLYWNVRIYNRSTMSVEVQFDDLSSALTLDQNEVAELRVYDIGTSNGSWDITKTAPPSLVEADPLSLHLDGSKVMAGDIVLSADLSFEAGSASERFANVHSLKFNMGQYLQEEFGSQAFFTRTTAGTAAFIFGDSLLNGTQSSFIQMMRNFGNNVRLDVGFDAGLDEFLIASTAFDAGIKPLRIRTRTGPGVLLEEILLTGAGNIDITGDVVLVSGGLQSKQISTPSNPPALSNKLYFKSDNELYKLDSGGTEVMLSSGGGGETNTASNVNAGGVGVFKQKAGVDLEFRGINAASNKVSVALDGANNEIDIDVNEGNLSLTASQITDYASATATFTNKTIDADGTGNSITNIENSDIKSGAAIALNKLASTTANRMIISNGSGVIGAGSRTTAETDILEESQVDTTTTTDDTNFALRTIAIIDNTAILVRATCVGVKNDLTTILWDEFSAAFYRNGGASVKQGSTGSKFSRSISSAGMSADWIASGNDAILQVNGNAGITMNWKCQSRVIRR